MPARRKDHAGTRVQHLYALTTWRVGDGGRS
jgi:hypothetical protein